MIKPLLFILVYTSFTHYQMLGNCSNTPVREKRGLLDMVVTLWCYREKLKIPLLAINQYGCYCGTGGSGTPVDDVDRCCLLHDCCYRYARVDLQCHSKIKWQLYRFSCHQSKTECKSSALCGRMACECDKQFAECLTKAKGVKKYFLYNKKDLCMGPFETCPQMPPNMTSVWPWTQNPTNLTEVTGVSETDKIKSRKKRWKKRWKKRSKTVKWKDPKGTPLWI